MDAELAERREVQQFRFTSLDRAIMRSAAAAPAQNGEHESLKIVVADSGGPTRRQRIRERLMVLERMGLAEPAGHGEWRVRDDLENVLRSMQRLADRQKMLAVHGVPLSDERPPVAPLVWHDIATVEGRVLVHGEEEDARGTDARVHHIYYAPAMEELRNRGGLQTNSFIRLRRLMVNGSVGRLAWPVSGGGPQNRASNAAGARREGNVARAGTAAGSRPVTLDGAVGRSCRDSSKYGRAPEPYSAGSEKWKVLPRPGSDSTVIQPPCASTILLHRARPIPVPAYSRPCSRLNGSKTLWW